MRTYVILKAQFTLGVGVSCCIFENNRSSGKMGCVQILCINVNFIIDTMLKFGTKADPYFDIDAKCEWTFTT